MISSVNLKKFYLSNRLSLASCVTWVEKLHKLWLASAPASYRRGTTWLTSRCAACSQSACSPPQTVRIVTTPSPASFLGCAGKVQDHAHPAENTRRPNGLPRVTRTCQASDLPRVSPESVSLVRIFPEKKLRRVSTRQGGPSHHLWWLNWKQLVLDLPWMSAASR